MPEETYLTVAEVAEILKLNQQTIRNMLDRGDLPFVRLGRRVRIKRSDRPMSSAPSARSPPASRAPPTALRSASCLVDDRRVDGHLHDRPPEPDFQLDLVCCPPSVWRPLIVLTHVEGD